MINKLLFYWGKNVTALYFTEWNVLWKFLYIFNHQNLYLLFGYLILVKKSSSQRICLIRKVLLWTNLRLQKVWIDSNFIIRTMFIAINFFAHVMPFPGTKSTPLITNGIKLAVETISFQTILTSRHKIFS